MLTLSQSESGELLLSRSGRAPRPVLTVEQAGRRLRRSRRQIYRLLATGALGKAEKLLGEWLLDREMVEKLRKDPLQAQPVPSEIYRLFRDFPAGGLNAGRDRILIMTRLLSEGLPAEKGWLLKRYGAAGLRRYLVREGKKALNPEIHRHWKDNLAVKAGRGSRRPPPSPPACPGAGTSS